MKNNIAIAENNNLAKTAAESLAAAALKLSGIRQTSKDTYFYNMISYENYCEKNGIATGLESAAVWIVSAGSAKSVNTRYQSMRAVLKFMYGKSDQWLYIEDELKKIPLPSTSNAKNKTDYLTEAQVKKLIKNSPKKWGLFMAAAFETGARVSELAGILLADCVAVVDDAVYITLREAKGGQEYVVFMNPKTFQDVKSFYKGKKYLFEHHGKKFDRSYLTRVVNQLSKSILGIKISMHTFRHSKAMFLKERGLSADQIQKALHHKNVSTTLENYFHGEPSAEDQGII